MKTLNKLGRGFVKFTRKEDDIKKIKKMMGYGLDYKIDSYNLEKVIIYSPYIILIRIQFLWFDFDGIPRK